jgi:hypothetical protein
VLADPVQPGQSVLEEGSHVPAGTSQRLACDASRVVMRHDAEGLRLDARTTCPGWLGERLDVGWAIGVLHPLATRNV